MDHQEIFDQAIQGMLDSLKNEQEMTEKQRRILESAIKLFAEKGFHASSTSEIAKDAGVAEGTIFRHFKTKKDLLYALVAPMLIKFASPLVLKDVKRIMGDAEQPADQILEQLLHNRLELINQNWPRMKIIMQEAQFHPEIMDAIVENIAREARLLGENFVQTRMDAGEFRDLPVKAVIRAIVSTALGYIFFQHMFPNEENDRTEEIRTMVDILLNGIKRKNPD
ncbi:TetR/AcrR family transcriptional regulator [Aneurinibacillus terranovensis]|uniref:TetR/AcrR family transcriptional regulator n=1 Tax=Aneurinibacillus terranovensis TaxID=278991 RepID=UPI0004132411|nr:TetR/AcrR family transcriptional regulator [Aneurinibacillus terranovensis]